MSRCPGLAAATLLTLLTLLVSLFNTGRATAGGAFLGETISHVGDGGHDAWMIGRSQDVGFKYSYIAFLWVDLWTWDGTYCVYQRFEDKYVPISRADAARLLKKNESELQPPWWYRYPPALLVFGPILLIAAVVWVRDQMAKQSAESAADLAKEPRYREAWALALGPGGLDALGTASAFTAGVEHLVSSGVARDTAERDLAQLVKLTLTCQECGLRHPPGTAACTCGRDLTPPPEPAKPARVDRPFDIGKPLSTRHPVSQTCPNCGSTDYKSVQPATMVAFTWDRVCKSCSTRYTPPTPVWARLIFGAFGLASLAAGAAVAYSMLVRGKPQGAFGLLGPVVFMVVGFACLFKAVTK